jgi:exonuclease III
MATENNVTICSMNCQGLADAKKRRDVFHYLKTKGFSIYLLQDTHFNTKLENYIRSEWGYICHFASHNSSSRGVAILLNNNFEFQVKKVVKDPGGNYILILIKMINKEFLICNVYGPNRDDPDFYIKLKDKITEIGPDSLILGGDWNLVLNFELDYHNYRHNNNVKAQEQVDQMMIELDLTDIWRDLNPEIKRYTWRRNNPFQQSRLDFFLISDLLSSEVHDADILPGYRTDHSIILLSLGKVIERKRFSLWKFNASLLKDKEYLEEINNVITSVKTEYAAFLYNPNAINSISNNEIQFTISDQLFLDTLLMKIRDKTISYATAKKKKNNETEKALEIKITELEQKVYLQENEKHELQKAKRDLVSLRENRMHGVLIRSRARWIADGEKVTKYFCSMEKRNYVNKHMFKLKKQDETVLTDSKDIISEVNRFYERLYAEREVESCSIEDLIEHVPRLTEFERNSLEGMITLVEASQALKNMNNGKSPGSDGFSAEFFKVFWNKLGDFVVRSLNDGFLKGELSSTQKEGVIICIPKGDKDREYIKNWRPISLLNVVYKIASACIANRLKAVLPSIIHEDQSGFIKNRYLGDNIRLIYDLIDNLNANKQPGLLLCLDFEKAFDSVSWNFMFKVLEAFGFGPDFLKWIHTFYNRIKSSVFLNGTLGSWFHVQRGCRQGDPISPYLFIICVEILGIMIRENRNIKGILIKDVESKISQYADDTELMLEGDRGSFEEAVNVIQNFGKKSGLLLNTDKSSAIWLGSMKYSRTRFMPHLRMEWNPDRFKILGIWFTVNLKDIVDINFGIKFQEIKNLYKVWLKRQITPLGRVAVLKSLILSKLVHLWLLLPNPPDVIVKELQTSVFQFVWGRKNDKISRKIAVKNIEHGGIGIPDVRKFINALKVTWIRKLLTSKHKWTYIIKRTNDKINILDKLGTAIDKHVTLNLFWRDVFKTYKELGLKLAIDRVEEIGAEPVFCNEKILVGGETLFNKSWIEKGVFNIGHFLEEGGDFFNFQAFRTKYGINTNFLTYTGCVNAIKTYISGVGVHVVGGQFYDYGSSKVLRQIVSVVKGARIFYDILCQDQHQPNCCKNWENRLEVKVLWKNIFQKIKQLNDTRLKWLQIRIVHRILGTNTILYNMGIEKSNKCTFCNSDKESIQHLFWSCHLVQQFWVRLKEDLNNKCPHAAALQLSEHLVIFGCNRFTKTDDVLDLIIVLAKSFIYKCKMSGDIPLYDAFVPILKNRYYIEQFIASTQMRGEKFKHMWQLYLPLFLVS